MASEKAMKLTMFDEFEIKGLWWLPDQDKHREAGILLYSENEIRLELIGSLSDELSMEESEKYEVIHGFSDKGEEFTLLDVLIINNQISAPGFQTQKYSISSFIVGGHFDEQEKIEFHSVSFQPTYLTKWLSRPVFNDETVYKKHEGTLESKRAIFNHVDTFSAYVEVLDANIEETYSMTFRNDFSEEVLWTNKNEIKIIPKAFKSLSWFHTNLFLIKDLLTLFIGHATYFESIKFYGEEHLIESVGKKYRKPYKYFFSRERTKLKKKLNSTDVIVKFEDIEQDIERILNLWFEKHKELEVIYNIHFGEFYKDWYIDTTFLNTIQILEIYHRRIYDGKVYDKQDYKKYTRELNDILNDKFSEEFALLISNKLSFGNEFSLAMRINEITSNFNETTRDKLIGGEEDINKFIRQLVDTRNYLTHYDSDKKKNILHDPIEKYFAVKRLRAIATLLLFLEVGLDEELMLDKIFTSRQYSYTLNEAKNILN